MFDTSEDGKPLKFNAGIGKVIKGWDEMLLLMRVGDEVEVIIPAALAYGGHWKSLKNPQEAADIRKVEADEWSHRAW